MISVPYRIRLAARWRGRMWNKADLIPVSSNGGLVSLHANVSALNDSPLWHGGEQFDMTDTNIPWRVRWAAWRFKRELSAYYAYIAACIDVQARHRSLLEFLQLDAKRHVGHYPRAVLAHWWAQRYLNSGANLTQTLRGTLPESDIACLELAQSAGLQAMLQMLRALAHQRTQLEQSRKHFAQTTLTGVIALLVALMTVTALPAYTVPKLTQSFSFVSPDRYGVSTRCLCAWLAWLGHWGWVLPLLLCLLLAWVRWSLAHWSNGAREWVDGCLVWRLWRDVQTLEFLSLTATLVETLGPRGVSLRAIVEMQIPMTNPYRQEHLQRMLVAMDLGRDSVDAMNTGMMSRACYWRLQDLVHGFGLTQGFTQCREKILVELVAHMARQALCWRVVLLTSAVGTVLWMGYWHAQVIEEMRQALLLGVVV